MDNQPYIENDPEVKLSVILPIIFLLLVIGFIFNPKIKRDDVSVPSETVQKPFPTVILGAKAAYVYDVRTKTVLFVKNENVRLPLASLTKIMSALVALETSPSYGTVSVTGEALQAEGDSGLYKDEKWLLKSLLDFSLMTSSNDGMRAVALSLGALSRADASSEEIIDDYVREMNRRAGELDLKNTYFWNETGLDLSTDLMGRESEVKGGAYGTAKDVSMLLEYIITYHPELLEATKDSFKLFQSLDNNSHLAKNTNSIISDIPGLLASKTGFTDTAGGNLVIVFDPELGRPIIVSVLGSTGEGRFDDVRALVNAVMQYLNNN